MSVPTDGLQRRSSPPGAAVRAWRSMVVWSGALALLGGAAWRADAAEPPEFSIGGRKVRVRPGSVFEPHAREASQSAAGGASDTRPTPTRISADAEVQAQQLRGEEDTRSSGHAAREREAGRSAEVERESGDSWMESAIGHDYRRPTGPRRETPRLDPDVIAGDATLPERAAEFVTPTAGREPALLPAHFPPPQPIVIYPSPTPAREDLSSHGRPTSVESILLLSMGFVAGLGVGLGLLTVPLAIAWRRSLVTVGPHPDRTLDTPLAREDLPASAQAARSAHAPRGEPERRDSETVQPPTGNLFDAVLEENLKLQAALRRREADSSTDDGN